MGRPKRAGSLVVYAPSVPSFVRENEQLAELLRMPTIDEMRTKLQERGVSGDAALRGADASRKIAALASLHDAYLPTDEVTTFVLAVHARIRNAFLAKDFSNERFRSFFYSPRDVLAGDPLLPMSASIGSPGGIGLTLDGPSGMGRTALIKRLRKIYGRPFRVRGNGVEEPVSMWVIPMLSINYPTCGTLKGLISDFREAIVSEIGRADTPVNTFGQLRGDNAENALIAACLQLNVAFIAMDGAGFNSIEGEPDKIIKFLVKLQQRTGIPLLISGTCAYMYMCGLSGNKSSNLFNGPSLHFDPMPAPGPLDIAETSPQPSIWYQMNRGLWEIGTFSTGIAMPRELPFWVCELTQMRTRWLVEGLEPLFVEIAKKPKLALPGQLTREEVTKVFERQLRLNKSARLVIAESENDSQNIADKQDFFNYIDHLRLEIIRQPKMSKWLHAIS
jgi:hypothetical protein